LSTFLFQWFARGGLYFTPNTLQVAAHLSVLAAWPQSKSILLLLLLLQLITKKNKKKTKRPQKITVVIEEKHCGEAVLLAVFSCDVMVSRDLLSYFFVSARWEFLSGYFFVVGVLVATCAASTSLSFFLYMLVALPRKNVIWFCGASEFVEFWLGLGC
jgi:hypothetical protein